MSDHWQLPLSLTPGPIDAAAAEGPPRSAADLDRFLRLIAETPALAEDFWDMSDEQLFVERVIRRGEALGCWFSAAHVEQAMRAAWGAWLERANR
jgi:hypothetical protein